MILLFQVCPSFLEKLAESAGLEMLEARAQDAVAFANSLPDTIGEIQDTVFHGSSIERVDDDPVGSTQELVSFETVSKERAYPTFRLSHDAVDGYRFASLKRERAERKQDYEKSPRPGTLEVESLWNWQDTVFEPFDPFDVSCGEAVHVLNGPSGLVRAERCEVARY